MPRRRWPAPASSRCPTPRTDVTTTRSELGLRADASFSLAGLPLALRGVAWVHNFDTATSAVASFQSLPGATFLVSGAALDRNALRTTATAELDLKNGLSLAATFDGEFARTAAASAARAHFATGGELYDGRHRRIAATHFRISRI